VTKKVTEEPMKLHMTLNKIERINVNMNRKVDMDRREVCNRVSQNKI